MRGGRGRDPDARTRRPGPAARTPPAPLRHGSLSNLGYLLVMASRAWNRRLMEMLKKSGYRDQKPSYGAVFVPLFDRDGMTISEIIEISQVSKQTLGAYVRELSEKGYIATRPDREDLRFTRVFLTSKGKALRRAANRAVAQVNREFVEFLEPREYRALVSAFRKWVRGRAPPARR